MGWYPPESRTRNIHGLSVARLPDCASGARRYGASRWRRVRESNPLQPARQAGAQPISQRARKVGKGSLCALAPTSPQTRLIAMAAKAILRISAPSLNSEEGKRRGVLHDLHARQRNSGRGMQGSNLRHPPSKCGVLPTELIPSRTWWSLRVTIPARIACKAMLRSCADPVKWLALRTGIEPVWPG